MKVDNILKAINMADMDGVKQVTVDIDDLLILRETINNLRLRNANLRADLEIAIAKSFLKEIEKPIKLDYYA